MIKLRPYQIETKRKIYEAWGEHRKVLMVLPTGMGKTKTFCTIARDLAIDAVFGENKPTAIIVHRKELVQQISLTLAEENITHNIIAPRSVIKDIISAQRSMFNKQFYNYHSMISVVSVDTLNSRAKTHNDWCKKIRLWIVDEAAHLLVENKWGQALANFSEDCLGLGVTATPRRLDRKGLGSHAEGVFDVMVQGPTTMWGIQKGFLCKYKIVVPQSDYVNFLKKASRNSDYSKKTMVEASEKSTIVGDVVSNYIKFAKGKQAIYFATDINTAGKMEKEFLDKGVPAKLLTGLSSDRERFEGMSNFRSKKINVLLNVDLFDEGLDVPGIEVVGMARPTMSLSKFLQMCLDESTEILTKRGWLKYNQMKLSDECAAFDTKTFKIKWCKNKQVILRDRSPSEKMFSLKSPHLDIRITSQHDVISKSRHSSNWIKKTIDETVKRKDLYHVPVSGHQDKQGVKLTDAELSFIGWFLSDGCKNSSGTVTISQCSNNKENLNHIRETLRACEFKYGEYKVKRTGELSKYDSMIMFSIPIDRPKRNFKGWEGLTGWKRLSEWLHKDIPECFDNLNREQFKILLHSYYLGDGRKKKNVNYTPRTMTITTGNNETKADRLQSLAVRLGFRCNKALEKRSHLGKQDVYNLHIKDVTISSIAGLNSKDSAIADKKPYKRSRFVEETTFKEEKVWCVENELETIVTRRNGKVVIMGNCGRGLRPAENKPHLILIDHVGNIRTHGLPDEHRTWTLDRIGNKKAKNLLKICMNPECMSPYDRTLTECPYCGCPSKSVDGCGGRIPPEMVDGDLTLVDPETLRELNAATMLEDPASVADRVSKAADGPSALRAMTKQRERIEAQKELIDVIAKWAGYRKNEGLKDREIHKRFFLLHDMTIAEALSKPRADMQKLIGELI